MSNSLPSSPQSSSQLCAGVMGWPIGHSLSPRLHGFWLDRYGIAGRYEAVPVRPEELAAALAALPAQGWRGVNLTVPLKETAVPLMAGLDDAARRIGAVNLVTVGADGALYGRNTDAYGFTQNLLSAGFRTPVGGIACVLGAGGAARAVLVALADMGFGEIRLVNRTLARATGLAQALSTPTCRIVPVAWDDLPTALTAADLLVNATSLGMKGQPPLMLDLAPLPERAWVCDIVYAPLETGLLAAARARTLRALDGLGMLLHQARPSFAAFFGRDPAVDDALRAFVLAGMTP